MKVTQLCLTLHDPMDLATRLLCPWNSPSQNTGVGSRFLLQGIFLTQGSNPSLLHCRRILYHLIQWILPTQESNWGLLHCSGFFTSSATREAPHPLNCSAKYTHVFPKHHNKPGEGHTGMNRPESLLSICSVSGRLPFLQKPVSPPDTVFLFMVILPGSEPDLLLPTAS